MRVLVYGDDGSTLLDIGVPMNPKVPCLGPALADVPRVLAALRDASAFMTIESHRRPDPSPGDFLTEGRN